MFKWFYLANACVAVFVLFYFLETIMSNINHRQLLAFIAAVVASYAYALGVFSESVEGGYVAFQLYYLACIVVTCSIFFIITDLCQVKINRYIRCAILMYGALILFLIATIDNNHLYYKSFSYAKIWGAAYLRKVYGPLHCLFLLQLASLNLSSFIIIFISYKKNRSISLISALYLLLVLSSGTMTYVLPRMFNIYLEFLPFYYTAMEFLMVYFLKRISMYDMTSNLINVYEQRLEYGYISLDNKKRFLGANDFSKKLFPSLNNIPIDSVIKPADTKFGKIILPWLDAWIAGDQKNYVHDNGELTAVCSIRYIIHNKKRKGYLIEIKDVTQQQKYLNLLNNYNEQLKHEVTQKGNRISEMQDSIITGMASMVESRDNSTGGHIRRTSECVRIFIEELKKSEEFSNIKPEFWDNVIKAAPMHDLGKIAVDDFILRKPGKFTPEEYEKMKKHSEEGARIVEQVLLKVENEDFKKIAINIAHFHHEKWDGSGYPKGLKALDIPLEARIMAFADVFDALVSKRCYKSAFSYEQAFEIISKDFGSHFDSELGSVFLKCRSAMEKLYNNFED